MKKTFFITLFFSILISHVYAQYDNAGTYIEHINKANQALTEKYLFYLSAASHGKGARKVEKRRLEVVEMINNTRYDIQAMPPFKGDRTLRDTAVAYLKILNSVFNEDYGKIVDMEEIAEQSYDAMEAYMLAEQKATEKLREAAERQNSVQRQFAAKYEVTLIKDESATESKMKIASDVLKHYNEVYLAFFKAYKQEAYLLEAVNKKNINSIEQNINSLQNFSDQGLEKLKGLKGYNNDGSLIVACRNMLNFYKEEVRRASAMTDFYLKEENFIKIKKQFDAMGSKRTQKDIDLYNKGVKELNAATDEFNLVNNKLNKDRDHALDDWNKTVKHFMDNYMPSSQRS